MALGIISWALAASAVTGAILNARRDVRGFYVWIAGNIGWVTYNIYISEYALAALFVVYTGVSIYGIRQWRSPKK